jgi:hypothetical protein
VAKGPSTTSLQKEATFYRFKRAQRTGEGSLHPRPEGRGIRDPPRSQCNKPRVFDGNIPWITTPDLDDGRVVNESRLSYKVSISEAKSIGSKVVPSGSVLMSCAGELGIVALAGCDIVINQQLHAFLPTAAINGLFLVSRQLCNVG